MDKTNIVNTFTEAVDQLRNTECSEKEKIACFQKISECITSPLMHGHLNYATFCSKATNILLLFCEDLDPTCRVHAEENLNKIFRVLEKTRAHRILMDLYGEIKRNGNHRSLRICLRIFGYYAPRIREHSVRWYAQNLWPCLRVISRRKETLLQETLSEFVVKFGKYIQQGLTDSETCKLFEAFIENIGSDCAVKRRCTAQNCISLIEYASNKPLMAKYALNKVLEILIADQQPNTVIGVLGFLRQLVVVVIKGLTLDNNDNDDTFATIKSTKSNNSEESRQLLEIYDYCLYLVSSTPSSQHPIINAALEVINSVLQSLEGISAKDTKNTLHIGPQLLQWINDKNLKHASILRNKNTLKHRIFSVEQFDEVDRIGLTTGDITASQTSSDIILLQPHQRQQQQPQQHLNAAAKTSGIGVEHRSKRHTARSISECVDIDYVDEDGTPASSSAMTANANSSNKNADDDENDEDDDDGDFTTLSEMNDDSQHTQPSLLGNIDFTTKTSSSVINETISGLVDGSAASKIQQRHQDDVGSDGGGGVSATDDGDRQKFLVNFSSDDEKSTQLCNTDNESLNSIEFKADISRGLVVQGVHSNSDYNNDDDQQQQQGKAEETSKSSSTDAFTTFFNNFNAASESVTKLFRPSGSTSSSASKNVISPSTTADSLSLASNVSSLKRTGTEVEVIEDSSPESSKTFPTPSTAIMGEIRSLDSIDILSTTDHRPNEGVTPKDTPSRISRNPFLNTSPATRDNVELPILPVDIGSPYEQALVIYTARLIAARFLLTGNPKGLYDDATVRVSIKNICLNVISQCIRLRPEILEISLKFMQSEKLQEKCTFEMASDRQSPLQIPSDSSSNVGQDYEHLEVITTVEQPLSTEVPRKSSFTQLDVFRMDDGNEAPLLEIIDDHFGKSPNDFNFTATTTSTTMTRSADPILFSKSEDTSNSSPIMKTKKDKLSTSEILGVDTKLRGFVEITNADEDMPPEMLPPKPPKRTKTFRKSQKYNNAKKNELNYGSSTTTNSGIQYLQDILYFYNHEDPILRAGVQSIIGQYCRSNQAGLIGSSRVNLQYLLAILCMGLQDDIHTVVIQALNTFDKIFPYVLFKYMTITTTGMGAGVDAQGHRQVACHRHHQHHRHGRQHKEPTTMHKKEEQHCPEPENCSAADAAIHRASSTKLKCISGHFNDNDGIIAALLNAFQLQAYINNSNNNDSQASQSNEAGGAPPNNHIMSNDGGGVAAASVSYDCCSASSLLATCCCCCCCFSSSPTASHCCGSNLLFISPKLLLNKLRLCHYNKYWLVQNKYAEVISNLNYASLHSYYGNNYTTNNNKNKTSCSFIKGLCCSTSSDGCQLGCGGCCCCSVGLSNMVVDDDDVDGTDFVCSLENSFIEELLQLIAEDDVRVRECASKCLCRFIIQNAKHSNSHDQEQRQQEYLQQQQRLPFVSQDDENILHRTFSDNLRMLQSFFEYSIFNDMSPAVRYLFNPEYQQRDADDVSTLWDSNGGTMAKHKEAIQTVLSKVLYRLSNKLMSLKDKNVQFGIINCIKQLLGQFPFADYADAWSEFSFMEIFVKLSQYNYNTAVDLACQSDLIDVSCKLIVGSSIFYANDADRQLPRDHVISLLKHTMKIINIYYHIFTNQKPLIMAKSQKVEIFGNAKELAVTQSLGYFGNESIYLKLYQTLKSAYDNYKITINEEAGSKLISLLKTVLNSLSSCIEMLPHEATLSAASSATTINSVGGGGIAKNAMDATTSTTSFTSSLSSTSSLGQAGSSQGLDSVPVLKLIEETLQYLTKVINYAPEESIGCLRQLLKYLFARNYGNRQYQQQQQQPHKHQMKQGHYPAFIKSYFKAKCKEQHCGQSSNNSNDDVDVGGGGRGGRGGGGVSPTIQNNQTSSPANVTQKTLTTIQLQSTKSGLSGNVDVFSSNTGGYSPATATTTVSPQDDYLLLSELFASGLKYHAWKSPHETELARHIKLFEPLVIYCLTLFLKCNGRVQASILDMLILLLDFNVTYSSLDSKNVIFEQIIKSLDIIEGGIARNGLIIVTPMIRFLIKLSSKNERNLITIPKIISITNNLLANYSIRDVAVRALKTLTHEIFLMTLPDHRPDSDGSSLRPGQGTAAVDDPNSLAAITENLLTLNDELETQKEVILGMLEKFIESQDCQQLFCLLLLIEQLQQLTMSNVDGNIMTTKEQKLPSYDNIEVDGAGVGGSGRGNARQRHEQKTTKCLPNLDTVCNMICQSIYTNRLCIQDWHTYRLLDTFFKNNGKYLLGNSREFMALLKYIIEADVTNFSDLSYATIILSNVILKTEEIYLVNHIKLYLKNHPTTVEKLKRKQQQRQQTANTVSVGSQQQQHQQQQKHQPWLPDVGHDKPSTSSAARAAAAAAFSASSSPSPSSSSTSSSAYNSSGLNEYNYFPTVLCDVLFECLQTLAEHRRNSNSYSHPFSSQYCRLVGNFVKVLNKLCSNTRSDDFLLVSMRSILNGCESRLLNEYHNLLMMYSTQGCPPNATCCAQLSGSTSMSSATMGNSTGISMSGGGSGGGGGAGGGGVASSLSLAINDAAATAMVDNVMLQLQLELFQLLKSVGVLDTLALLQRLQSNDISHHVRRALLNKICQQSVPHATMEWNLQQVQQLFNGNFLNILIVEQFAFVCNLCEVDEEFCALFQSTVLTNIGVLNKHSIIYLLRLVENLCKKTEECSILRFAKCLQILNKLYSFVVMSSSASSLSSSSSSSSSSASSVDKRPLQLQIERLARHLIVNSSDTYDKNAIYDTFVHLIEEDEEQQQLLTTTSKEGTAASSLTTSAGAAADETASLSSSSSSYHFNSSEHLQFMILNDLENSCELNDDDGTPPLGSGSNIVDEKWIFNQLIKFSTQNNYDPGQIVKILLEIQSENKLQKIFNTANFDAERILKHTISHSLQAMLQTFRNNCIQYNPHIHYMRPNPLARVSLAQLMTRIVEATIVGDGGNDNKATVTNTGTTTTTTGPSSTTAADTDGRRKASLSFVLSLLLPIHLCEAVIALMENIKQIEVTALIYIESKFIDKFLSEHLLRPEHVNVLVHFIGYCCQRVVALCHNRPLLLNNQEQRNSLTIGLRCIDALLQQKFIWSALNQQQATLAKAPSSAGGGGSGSAMDADEVASTPLAKCELNTIICSLLDVVSLAGTLLLENTPFYKKYKNVLRSSTAAATTHSLASEPPQKHQQHHCCRHAARPPHQPQKEECKSTTTTTTTTNEEENFENIAWLTAKYNSKAIFLGKLIETKIGNYDKGICFGEYNNYSSTTFTFCPAASSRPGDVEAAQDLKGINNQFDFISLDVLLSIGISTLRMNLFYATAVTPLEIMQQQQRLLSCPPSAAASPSTSPSHHKNQSVTGGTAMVTSNSMLPIIPIESLSDVDILKSFVRRLSIFGFTTRQQFEEYFMTFLLLINKVYDENMVDQQEQFQIRSICLEAIMELLITYKSFPIVGNKLSLYHHTTRWNRINCDTISLKKLHEIQLIISPLNVFYHGNLERNLKTDTVIGTHYFGANQFDLNFIWQQMEVSSASRQSSIDDSDSVNEEILAAKNSSTSPEIVAKHLSGVAANTAYRNYQYFTRQSGVDYKSSSQLIFDVLMQMIEQNHILILPNLVKFTEICENREQIKQIWEKADYLKSHIPMNDTISHQYLIYLLCKTKGMLIPSHLEMLSLESLIKNYLKSSHLFVRCAALNGLLSLLESYSKTNTTIGRLSDELIRLKDIILSYIDKHGLIEESPLHCSDLHTKLIWTLNFCLMEWTSKLDPHCNVAYHTKMTVSKLLKKTSNEQIYLCILHGLERMIVQDNKVSNVTSSGGGGSGGDNQNQMLRPAIEKLALELAKLENEKFSIPALKLLLSCIYVGSSKQLENTELSNGIVQDDPEIIAQQTDKVDILLQCIKTANEEAAWIYGQVLCQMIRDLVPPKEILTKVIKEFLAINQPHSDVIAMIVFQVFRSAIDSSFLQQLQDWLTCSLPTFLSLPEQKAVWSLSVVFLSASINLHLMKLFPLLLNGVKAATATVAASSTTATTTPLTPTTPTAAKRMSSTKLGHHEIALFVTSAQDFYAKLGTEQKLRFRDAFKEFHHIKVYNKMLQSL